MQADSPKLPEDIRDAARFVLDVTGEETVQSSSRNRLLRQGVERNVEIMGEAMGRLARVDPETADRITDFRQIVAFRNELIQGYDGIDHARVWLVIQRSLPVLESGITELLDEWSGDG